MEKDEGEKVGEIGDVVFDRNFEVFIGFLIEDGKFLKRRKTIPLEIITSFEKELIIIDWERHDFLGEIDADDGITGEEIKFMDKEILTQDGECLGYIKDLLFSQEEGKLIGYIITEGIIEDITKGRSFVPNLSNIKINKENLIVNNEVKDLISKNKSYYKKLLELVER